MSLYCVCIYDLLQCREGTQTYQSISRRRAGCPVRQQRKEYALDRLQERIELLGRSLALLGTYAIVVGALSIVTNLSGIADGEVVAVGQAALGVVGVAAGLLVWTLRRVGIDGWQALMVWCVAQLPIIAWSTEGSPTTQMWEILLGVSTSTTVNGVVTSSEQYGLNAVGIALCIWATRSRERWDRRVKPLLTEQAPATTGAA